VAASESSPILPGGTLGILGGGQLGSMFAMAASRMGYRVEAISDEADCPIARHCDRVHVGDYTDTVFLARAAKGLDVVTFEFENIPVATGRALAAAVPVRPCPEVLFTTQDRGREKAFLTSHGFACVPYRIIHSRDDLQAAVGDLGLPAVLKTTAFGYDGKGQCRIATAAEVDAAWERLEAGPEGPQELVLEAWVDFECEISVVARSLPSPPRGTATPTTFSTCRACQPACRSPS
jgi:5-(carboxyamino)imidazole ribonucleotide synthase